MRHTDLAPDTHTAATVVATDAELDRAVAKAVTETLKATGIEVRKKQPPPKVGYSAKEAASVSSVGKTTLYQAIKTGELRALKKGARTIILARDLERWLQNLPPSHA